MNLDIRDLDPADIGRSYDIRTRAFGPLPAGRRAQWESDVAKAAHDGRVLAAYDDGLLVARAMIRPFSQYWGGQVLPMAGIAGVVVSPEYRRRGVGTALMAGMVSRTHELGYAVSALYPATVPVYRSTGWEIAGSQPRYTINARLLRTLSGGDVQVREVGAADAEELSAIMRAQYARGRANGVRDYTPAEFAEELTEESVFACATNDGFVVYGWERRDIVVYQLVAGSADTARALWAVVGSNSSVVDQVHAYLAPDDPVHQMLGECVDQQLKQIRWMLRVVDATAALSGRGYPTGVETEIPLVLDDPLLGGNCVAGRLAVSGGRGELVADDAVGTDPGALRLGPNGLAALYAGMSSATLTTAGLLAGGTPQHHALLDTVFAGRPAHLLDYF
ncbi:MAG: GNAT family N-acetyltransferase [Nocardioidaceae bacterium]